MTPVELQLAASLEMSKHTLEYGLKARQYDTSDFQDGAVKRIMNKLSDIERAGLPAPELEEVALTRPGTRSHRLSDAPFGHASYGCPSPQMTSVNHRATAVVNIVLAAVVLC